MIAAAILASGFARRMGQSKLTLEIGGRTFLQRAIDAATGTGSIGRCAVLLRPEDTYLVTDGQPIELITNSEADRGQSAAVRLATISLGADPNCEAIIFSVVDQPFMTSDVFEALAGAWQAGRGRILVSTFDGQRGSPVLFGREFFAELEQLSGDVGGRDVMRKHPESVAEVAMPDPSAGRDVDTWDDFLAVQRLQAYGGEL